MGENSLFGCNFIVNPVAKIELFKLGGGGGGKHLII